MSKLLRSKVLTGPYHVMTPNHFSEFDFELAIWSAREHTEIIWLDVACIDQGINSVEGRLEVGRQAAIFKGATITFIWLTTQLDQSLTESFINLHQASQSQYCSLLRRVVACSGLTKAQLFVNGSRYIQAQTSWLTILAWTTHTQKRSR